MVSRSEVLSGTVEKKRNCSAELLLAATASLLSERSAMDVSLSDISKRAGLNSALIKYYFGNKDGLLLAVLESDAEKAMGALEHLVRMPISAEQKLKVHISGIINAYFRSPYLNRLIHFMVEYGEAASSKRVTEIYVQPMVAAYQQIVEQGVEEGIFHWVDSRMLYYSLVGACEHLFHGAYSVPDTLGVPKITEDLKQQYTAHVSRIFLNGLMVAK